MKMWVQEVGLSGDVDIFVMLLPFVGQAELSMKFTTLCYFPTYIWLKAFIYMKLWNGLFVSLLYLHSILRTSK